MKRSCFKQHLLAFIQRHIEKQSLLPLIIFIKQCTKAIHKHTHTNKLTSAKPPKATVLCNADDNLHSNNNTTRQSVAKGSGCYVCVRMCCSQDRRAYKRDGPERPPICRQVGLRTASARSCLCSPQLVFTTSIVHNNWCSKQLAFRAGNVYRKLQGVWSIQSVPEPSF